MGSIQESRKPELEALTGVRAVAAVWVLGFHFYTSISLLFPNVAPALKLVFKNGDLGVDLFFILSGFIIAYNYQTSLANLKINGYVNFLSARFARIYPVHFVSLIACLILYLAALAADLQINTGDTNWGTVAFFKNLLLVHSWTSSPSLSWNFPSWSVSAEWMAYMLFPLIAWFYRLEWSRPALWTQAALLLGTQAYLMINNYSIMNWGISRIAFEFPLGVCLYNLHKARDTTLHARSQMLEIASITALALTLCLNNFYPTQFPEELIITFLGLFIFNLAAFSQGPISKLLSTKLFLFWGRASYSLYMTHAVTSMVLTRIIGLEKYVSESFIVRLVVFLTYFTAIGLVSVAMYLFIEEPARKLLKRSMMIR